jgi:ankyrin repeat protein
MNYFLSLFFFIQLAITAEAIAASSNTKDSDVRNLSLKDQQTENSNYCKIIESCLQGDLALFLTEFEKHKAIIKDICNLENEPLIISAVKGGNYKIVKVLLDNGVDIHSLNKDKNTPLHLAALTGNYKLVKLLLEYGADINKTGELKFTPILYAAQQGYDEIIQLLFDIGANLEHQDIYGRTPLLLAARFSKKESTVNKLLELGANINHQTKNKYTALHLVMENKNHEIVKILLDNGIDIDSQDKYKNTALHTATFYGYYKIVKLLLESGADIHKKAKLGYTPLCFASQEGHDEIIQLLIDRGSNLEHQDYYSRTPLLLAARFSNKESTVNKLLELKANINHQSKNKNTALHYATLCGNYKIIELLLKYGANINHKGNMGTPLHCAAQTGRDEIIQLLFDRGANLEYKDFQNITPLVIATNFSNKKSTVTKLCELGADPNNISIFNKLLMSSDMRNHLNIIVQQQTKTIGKKQSKNIHPYIATKKGHREVIQLKTIINHSKDKYL